MDMKTIEEIRMLTREVQAQQRQQVQLSKHTEQDKMRQRFSLQRKTVEKAIESAALEGQSNYEVAVRDNQLLSYLRQHFAAAGYAIEIDETTDGCDVVRLTW